ncbi:hypothetical protein BX616_003076 [Lobosporangium transversale]|nr:hypothetical protein BX616_003076 [Lobosporangium transversale]
MNEAAGVLSTENEENSEFELVKRFLVLNKDLLVSRVLEILASAYVDPGGNTVSTIFEKFLMQRDNEQRTLTVVDEHGKLFEKDTPVSKKVSSSKTSDGTHHLDWQQYWISLDSHGYSALGIRNWLHGK